MFYFLRSPSWVLGLGDHNLVQIQKAYCMAYFDTQRNPMLTGSSRYLSDEIKPLYSVLLVLSFSVSRSRSRCLNIESHGPISTSTYIHIYTYKQIRGTISFFPHPGPRANNISISISINVNSQHSTVNVNTPTPSRSFLLSISYFLNPPLSTLDSLIPTLYSLPPSSSPLSALHHKRIKETKKECKYKYMIENRFP